MKTLYEQIDDDEDDSFPGDDENEHEDDEFDEEDDSFPGDDDQEDDEFDEDEHEDEDDSFPGDDEDEHEDDEFDDDEFDDDESFTGDDEHNDDEFDEDETDDKLDQVVNKATENPDRQGVIRNVPGAHLVYKRQSPDGTYEELWVYSVDDMQKGVSIRRSILAGTDIKVNKTSSESDEQHYVVWSVGNGECLNIKGLPN